MKTKPIAGAVNIRGFFKVQITEDQKSGRPKIVGDSGWMKNTTTNDGIRDYLIDHLIGAAGEKEVRYAALASGGVPASNATALVGELQHAADNNRVEITGGTSIIASRTAQFTGLFSSQDSYVTISTDISSIGLFSEQSDTGADLFAGNTFASSSFDTNQNVNFTYQIRFSSA